MFIEYIKRLKSTLRFSGGFSVEKALIPDFNIGEVSEQALRTARSVRGGQREPAIFIHGVMPRCGTVYVGQLMRLHPDIYAYPNDVWEVPFLNTTGHILAAQRDFFQAYKHNKSRIGENDFLPLFGSSFIAYLFSFVPERKRMLVKIPHVCFLNYFYSVFPYEHLLLVMRDGRDLVSSTIKTWPERNFPDVCKRWDYSTKMILRFRDHMRGKRNGVMVAKYEDAVRDPVGFARNACEHFGLKYDKYSFEKIKDIKVHGSSVFKQQGNITWDGKEKTKDFNPIGHWYEWSSKKKKIFKKIAGQTLLDAGYCDDMDW